MMKTSLEQRAMLERLTALLSSVIGALTPLAVATLEALRLLLELLGEIPPATVALLETPLRLKAVAPSAAVRCQVANLPSLA